MIYVMRHGQSTVNLQRVITCRVLEGDLTAAGRTQSGNAARWLAAKGVTQVYHSPFHRAAQTGEIIAKHLGVTPVSIDSLREIDGGELEGRSDEEAWLAWVTVYRRWLVGEWEAQFPGGESYRQGFERYAGFLRGVGENAVVVTHGGITCSVLPYLCVNAAALQGERLLDYTGIIALERYDSGRFICRAWNSLEHLVSVESN
jgi:broad specificity phosphatase PhoE